MVVTVTGASGLIGRAVGLQLQQAGHQLRGLVRSVKDPDGPWAELFSWSSDQPAPIRALQGADVLIHLAGEGIADRRWTAQRKNQLRDSRVAGTRNLLAPLAQIPLSERPKVLLSASAIGYYGSRGEELLTEESAAGQDFLAQLCSSWEQVARQAEDLGVRVVIMRFGLVLASQGGYLQRAPPVILGRGQAWMSWIHVRDLTEFMEFAIGEPQVRGIYNLVAPEPLRNADFTRQVAHALGHRWVPSVPPFALKLALGEMSEMVLASQRVTPERVVRSGFHYRYPHLSEALANLFAERK
jgi:uncharacterized protein (TIGR01777 family)